MKIIEHACIFTFLMWSAGTTAADQTPVKILPVEKIAATAKEKDGPLFSSSDNTLVFIDGKESTVSEMRKLNPDTIESVSILKDKTALQLYGEKGKNGVILVKLKPPEKTEMPVVVITDNLKIPAADTNFFVNCRCRCSSKDILNALIIIDGKESAESELRALNPDRIESFSVLKDETAINLYGEKGKNGVILIGLKDGLSIPDYRIRQGNTGYQE